MKFKGELKAFQKEGLAFALEHPYHINNFEAGLGKTITSLAVAYETKSKTLVVCPAFLKNNWLKEIAKFTEGLDITVTSYSSLHKLNPREKFDTVICDECHYLKNHKAKRTEALHDLLITKKPKYFMGLSGTPVSNRVSEFWSLLQACYHGGHYDEFKPYYRLYYKFCNTFSNERTFEVNGVPIVRFDGLKNIERLKSLIAPVLIRRRADQVLDLPDEVEMNVVGKVKKYDDDLKKAFELFKVDANDPAYMSLKSSNALAKVSTTIQHAKELIEQGYRPLIFTCHRASAEEISRRIGCLKIDGNVTANNRQSIIDGFNDGVGSALVCTIGSASTGFNITGTNYTIFNDLPFVPAEVEQAKKRTLRIGQTKTCFYYYIFTSEFDEKLSDMIQRKSNDINKIYAR